MIVDDNRAAQERWFALYTQPHKEFMVRDQLRGHGIETYLPEVHVANPRRDRRVSKPFFPHYLFARFDPRGGSVARIRWTPGLRSIVSSGQRPLAVPEEVVNHIRRRLERMGTVKPADRFQQGQIVHITRGPFRDLDAVFDQRLSPEGRVRVFLELMGRLVAADLDAADLTPR